MFGGLSRGCLFLSYRPLFSVVAELEATFSLHGVTALS